MYRPVLVASLLALVSCGTKTPPTAAAATATKESEGSTLIQQMHTNLANLGEAHIAVIRGDLDALKAATAELSRSPKVDDFPAEWVERQLDLMMAAQVAGQSENLDTAGARTVVIAQKCGACHAATGKGPRFFEVEGNDEVGDIDARMDHHAWGADVMWKGLVSNDPEMSARGASILAVGALPPEEGVDVPEEIAAVEKTMLAEAVRAAESTDLAVHASALGRILPTCGRCHTAAQVDPNIAFEPTLRLTP